MGSRARSFNLHQSVLQSGLHPDAPALTSGSHVPPQEFISNNSDLLKGDVARLQNGPAWWKTNKIHVHPPGHEMTADERMKICKFHRDKKKKVICMYSLRKVSLFERRAAGNLTFELLKVNTQRL